MYVSMHVLIFQYQRDNLNWFYGHLQFAYDCDPIQLTFLRLLSNHAKQTITYHCLNSTAWFREGSGNYEHSIRLKADNGIEIHAKGTRKYKPTVVLDECQVTRFYSKPIATRLQTIETPLNFISCFIIHAKVVQIPTRIFLCSLRWHVGEAMVRILARRNRAKYPCRDQTCLICRRSVPQRHDQVTPYQNSAKKAWYRCHIRSVAWYRRISGQWTRLLID